MSQNCDCKVEDVLFEREGRKTRINATTSRLSGGRNSLMAEREKLEHRTVRLAASHLWLKSLLSSSVSGFGDEVDRLVGEEVPAHRAMLTDLVASAWNGLELDLHSIVEFLCAAERGGGECTADPETSGTPLFMLLGPGIDSLTGQP